MFVTRPSGSQARRSRIGPLTGAIALLLGATAAADAQRPNRANWDLAETFSNDAVRRSTYSASVQPRWIGKTDSIWYNWRARDGSTFYLVVPALNLKRPLFDHQKLASALSTEHRKPYDARNLPFSSVNFTKDHKAIRFRVDSTRYEWSLASETIKNIGRPPRADSLPPDEEREFTRGGAGGGGRGGAGGRGGGGGNFRNYAPDSTVFVFAREHNLYLVEVGKPDTIQISRDGERNRSFGWRDTTENQRQIQWLTRQGQQGGGQQGEGEEEDQDAGRDPRVRANVSWSPDSRAFSVVRSDSRKVKELYLVNVLNEPRPALVSYTYAMPGEENVSQNELYVYRRGEPEVKVLDVAKWKDQRLVNTHWTTGSERLRVVRRDRLQRNLEMIEIDLGTKAIKTILTESVESSNLEVQAPRYVRGGGDLIWWSERSGWGHYYLYDHNGTYKRPLTAGAWRADQIADVDSVAGIVWVTGVGRETGENVYFRHLYRVNADGSGFQLVDAGNGDHGSTLTPTTRYVIDNYSRPDTPTKSVLRDATGRVVMNLEEQDVSKLREMGWRPPESFVVKAADGVTDIYGNMWKPFDFDSTKKYPIIASVYPGPQTESVNTTFNPGGGQQQLAQLGFIVIQIGNRGGSPLRSNAYQSHSYFNLRDYALADKKAGIEQLAAKYPWIDLEKVGIYGGSGGGFLTGAALLSPPYNDFFKVGVSSAGNHDNNMYNQNWSEQYHGLKLVPVRPDSGRRGRVAASGSSPLADNEVAADTVKFEIHVPTNPEVAQHLKGKLLLVHGDLDNNVHPGNTIRLVNALIKANKRFDMMMMPGKPHGFGDYSPYFNRMLQEYFAEHLLGDYYRAGAEIK